MIVSKLKKQVGDLFYITKGTSQRLVLHHKRNKSATCFTSQKKQVRCRKARCTDFSLSVATDFSPLQKKQTKVCSYIQNEFCATEYLPLHGWASIGNKYKKPPWQRDLTHKEMIVRWLKWVEESFFMVCQSPYWQIGRSPIKALCECSGKREFGFAELGSSHEEVFFSIDTQGNDKKVAEWVEESFFYGLSISLLTDWTKSNKSTLWVLWQKGVCHTV